MKGSHVHLGVKDLAASVRWFDTVWQLRPTFLSEKLATLPFGSLTLVLDSAAHDSVATIGFESEDCDADVSAVEARGGTVLEKATNRAFGVRSAYIQGPGSLRLEIEQPLPVQR